eukprot:3935044-Rhodomonas_salina.1
MQSSMKAAAFVAPVSRFSVLLPRTHDVGGAHRGNLPSQQLRLDTVARGRALVSHMPVILRPFTTMSMALKDFDDTDGNKTDIFGSVGAAGNLRFPGKGFQPPVDPVEKAAPKVDRANFDVKPDDDEKSVSFEEKQKKASFEDVSC